MASSRTIALVTAFPPGKQTLNEYGYHLVKGFAERPDVDRVIVLADQLEAPAQELDLGPKVEVQRVWRFNALGSQITLLRAIRRCKVDLVLFNLQMASFGDREIPAATGLFLPLLARLSGKTSGAILHNVIGGVDLEQTVLRGQRLRQWLVRTVGRLVTRALLGATYVTTTLPAYYDLLRAAAPRAALDWVQHGTFDLAADPVAPSKRPLTLNTMGKFGTYKRLETLITAFKKLRQSPEFKDLRLHIGGTDHPNTPGYMASLEKEHGQDPAIDFAGYVAEDAVPAFFAGARLSVFDYSSTTGSSGVLHQACAYGTVPVFPNIGDFVEVAKGEGVRGYHYEPNDVGSMAAALGTALRAPAELDALAASNLAAADHMPFSKVIAHHMDQVAARAQNAKPASSPAVA